MVCNGALGVQALRFPRWCRLRSVSTTAVSGPLGISYKVIYRWLLLVLAQGHSVKSYRGCAQLLLV